MVLVISTYSAIRVGPCVASRGLVVMPLSLVSVNTQPPMNLSQLASSVILLAALLVPLSAQVTLKRSAVVFCGNASNTTAPATIDEAKAKEATKEWKRMQADGIDHDSAQGKQLLQQINNKVREAVKAVANDASRDLVVRKDDITDKKGRDVADLTDKVVAKLGE